MKSILWFKDITLDDVPRVGGKNASLGEMIGGLKKEGVAIPDGFALTAEAYNEFLDKGGIKDKIANIASTIDTKNIPDLNKKSRQIMNLILNTSFPKEIEGKIFDFYKKMSEQYRERETDVAVRSSGTAEDLPDASFAGIHESYLNVKGKKELLLAIKKCYASLFGARAISYRRHKGFSDMKVALSAGVQKMVRSDTGSAGVMFSLDTESGFPDVVLISGSWGLGEMVVQGKVITDEFIVSKRMLLKGHPTIIKKSLGAKRIKMIYAPKKKGKNDCGSSTKVFQTSEKERGSFVLSEDEILRLAYWAIKVENHYSKKAGEWRPMDIEWAKDGKTGRLFLVQARPETIHSNQKNSITEYALKSIPSKPLIKGMSIGSKIGQGKANVIKNVRDITKFKKGEVLVTEMTDPDWEQIMKIASAIVTDRGSRVCHAAIISRELGIPCIVGTKNGTEIIPHGKDATIDCSQGEEGYVYGSKIPFEIKEYDIDAIPKTRTKVCLNVGSPNIAFKAAMLPSDGVGLAREEFLFLSEIKVHPLALLNFDKLDKKTQKEIEIITAGWDDKRQYFIDKLSRGIGRIATAFYPKEVILRFSDFKSNEYAKLVGGKTFEPENESNPMIGWRGASRYYSEEFKEAFSLECQAIKKARDEFGLKNISLLIPFCRTIEEGKKTIELIQKSGLIKGHDNLKIYVMCEIPSNIILAKEFLDIFDGFSIGSNDLTQLTLGLDRDSDIVANVGNENNEAVKIFIKQAVKACKDRGKYCGICGQAPSDYPEFAEFLVDCGIDSISVTPDVAIKTKMIVADKEKKKKNYS